MGKELLAGTYCPYKNSPLCTSKQRDDHLNCADNKQLYGYPACKALTSVISLQFISRTSATALALGVRRCDAGIAAVPARPRFWWLRCCTDGGSMQLRAALYPRRITMPLRKAGAIAAPLKIFCSTASCCAPTPAGAAAAAAALGLLWMRQQLKCLGQHKCGGGCGCCNEERHHAVGLFAAIAHCQDSAVRSGVATAGLRSPCNAVQCNTVLVVWVWSGRSASPHHGSGANLVI